MVLYAIAIFALLAIVALELFDRLPRGLAIVATDRYYCGNTAGLWTCTIDRNGAVATGRLVAKKDRGYNRLLDFKPEPCNVDATQEIEIATIDRVWIQDHLAITEVRADRLAESVGESMGLLVSQLRENGPQDLAFKHAAQIHRSAQLVIAQVEHAIRIKEQHERMIADRNVA